MKQMSIRSFYLKLKKQINLQFIKHSWIDMKRDKAKAVFAIGGIAVSIFLLTAVGMLNDTMSYNYMSMITNTTGSADIMITRTIQTDLTFDPFFDESIINTDLQDIEGVEQLFPKVMMFVKCYSPNADINGSLQIYGMDFELEAESGKIGELRIVDENGVKTGELFEDEPGTDECVITYKVTELLNVSIGDEIRVEYQQWERNITVIAVVEQYMKFLQFETALILCNLPYTQQFLNRPGKINLIYGLIENPTQIYDTSDLSGTTRALREIGANIQDRLNINDYSVTLPKLEELESGEMLLMATTMIFWFITILSMLITGILINSILSTSAEERVREFGILRVVGSKKQFPVQIVLFEGFLMGVFGSIIGVILGLVFTPLISGTFLSMFSDFIEPSSFNFIVHFDTILLAFSIGAVVSVVIAMIPALKSAKIDLIKSITPFQTKEEGWEITKEGSMNTRSFLIGISIAVIGFLIFVLFPRVITTGDMMLFISIFVGLLAAILIGLVFASVGIIPLIQRLFVSIVTPAIKRYSSIVQISLKRYRRRNTSTVVMFAISFSFIFFITGISKMEAENFELNFKFQYGADLVIVNQGLDPDSNAVTLEMVEELALIDGIDEIAYAVHNGFDIQAALSLVFDFSEGGMGFDEDSAESQITDLFSFYTEQWETKYEVILSDLTAFDNIEATFIGVDQDFVDIVDEDLTIWSSTGSGFNASFTEILNNNNTCIIAKSMADILGVQDVGETVRLTFKNPQVENDPGNISLFTVAGISGGIPGFWNFRSSEYSAPNGGVMVSSAVYASYMDTLPPTQNNMICDKVFINLDEATDESIKKMKELIKTLYPDQNFIIDDAVSKINFITEMNDATSIIMEVILMFTIMISIFGLVSSMYAIMLERKFEIGILRSMGMKARNVRNMFLLESLVILLSAGIMGTIIGSYSAYLMQTNLGLITEMPVIFAVPIDTLVRTFVISVSVGILGTYLILMKLSRQSIMDIFRSTF